MYICYFMVAKAIEGRYNVKPEVKIGSRVSDFWLSDNQHRSFLRLVQTKKAGSYKKEHEVSS